MTDQHYERITTEVKVYNFDHRVYVWCERCDDVMVDSEDPLTGSYYTVAGDVFPLMSHEYRSVVFALCTACERKVAAMLTRE